LDQSVITSFNIVSKYSYIKYVYTFADNVVQDYVFGLEKVSEKSLTMTLVFRGNCSFMVNAFVRSEVFRFDGEYDKTYSLFAPNFYFEDECLVHSQGDSKAFFQCKKMTKLIGGQLKSNYDVFRSILSHHEIVRGPSAVVKNGKYKTTVMCTSQADIFGGSSFVNATITSYGYSLDIQSNGKGSAVVNVTVVCTDAAVVESKKPQFRTIFPRLYDFKFVERIVFKCF